jgi:3-deoxy-D-manno-octulosonate 8-phosphate phosphatase (KDO 8-P phosphatase)
MKLDPALAKPIKLLILDVDGVLTDGRIVMDNNGIESKFFHVRDGHGLKMLSRTGVRLAFLTGRESRVVAHRAADLGVDIVHQGAKNKIEVYEGIINELGLSDHEVAMAGDDIVDLPVMRRVGLAMCPSDAIDEIKAVCHLISALPGGRGAVREMVEALMKAQDTWEKVTARYY